MWLVVKLLHGLSVILHLMEVVSAILSENLKILRDQPRESDAPGCSSLLVSGLTPFLDSSGIQNWPWFDTPCSLVGESYRSACSVVREGHLPVEG